MGELNTLTGNLLNILTGIALGIATLFFAWGALRYAMSGGNPRSQEAGKTGMTDALVGFGLVLAARIIVGIISSAIPR